MVDKQRQAAANARWRRMTLEERKSAVAKAQHARWDRQKVMICSRQGEVRIGDVTLQCAVLEDGRRIISERGFCEAINHTRRGGDYREKYIQQESSEPLPVYVPEEVARYLSPSSLKKLAEPIRYRRTKDFGIPAVGVDASVIPDLCEAYLQARDDGVLLDKDIKKAVVAQKLIRAFARIALVALIDEATGYQVEREKDELQKLLNKYIAEEFRPYTPIFPTEFYIQVFRLKGMSVQSVKKRPSYFGRITNEVVYDRLLPGILNKLRELNPVQDGVRKRKHHQHLSDDIGVQHLKNHLLAVIVLMKAAISWKEFEGMLDRAIPKPTSEESPTPLLVADTP